MMAARVSHITRIVLGKQVCVYAVDELQTTVALSSLPLPPSLPFVPPPIQPSVRLRRRQ